MAHAGSRSFRTPLTGLTPTSTLEIHMSGEFACFLIIAFLVALCVFVAWTSAQAKKTDETIVKLSPGRAADLIEDSVGRILWARVDGEGDLNFKRRSPHAPTLSAGLTDLGDGRTRVELAMTQWREQYGWLVYSGEHVWLLKRKILKNLNEAGL